MFRKILDMSDWRRPLRIVALAAIVLRLGYIFIAHPPLNAISDSPGYDRLAHNLLAGRGFAYQTQPSAERTPGYPLFVASIYALGGNYTTVTIVQAVLDGGSLLLLGPIGASLGVSPAGIVAAAALVAVFPPLVQQPAYLMTESLYQLLLLAALAVTLHVTGMRTALYAGLLWGLAVLVRPTFVYFVAILALWIAFRERPRRWLASVGLGVAFLFTLAPWMIRNERVLGAPVLSTFGYQNIYAFNSRLDQPDWTGTPLFLQSVQELCARQGWGPNAVLERSDWQVDSLCRAEALRLITAHPGRFVALSFLRVARLWGNVGYGTPPSNASQLVAIFMGILLVVLHLGFFRAHGWRSWSVMLLMLLFIYNTAAHAVSVSFFRFNQPILPVFFLLVAWAAITFRDEGRRDEFENSKFQIPARNSRNIACRPVIDHGHR